MRSFQTLVFGGRDLSPEDRPCDQDRQSASIDDPDRSRPPQPLCSRQIEDALGNDAQHDLACSAFD